MALLQNHEVELIGGKRKLIKSLEGKTPDIVYAYCLPYELTEITELFKDKRCLIVSHNRKEADIFIHGEAEQVFPVLVEAMDQGNDFSQVPGITYRMTTDKAKRWEGIDTLPATANYKGLALSTRGCKGQCSFCNLHLTQGNLRYRDISKVIEEVKGMGRHYRFADCSFDSNTPERLKELLFLLTANFRGRTFEANFRPDFHKMVDNELIDDLYYSGCVSAFIGVEAANEEDLELYNKKCTPEDIEKTLNIFDINDTEISIGFINIGPFSTIDRLRKNLEFLKRHHFATPCNLIKKLEVIDGTPIKQVVKDAGLLLPDGKGYIFKDEKIEHLAAFLKMFEEGLHKNALATYNDMSLRQIKRYKRQAVLFNDEERVRTIAEYEPKQIDIINQASDRMAAWFGNLLDMIEKKGEPEILVGMSDSYLNNAYLKEINRQFSKLQKELTAELNKERS